MRLMIDGHVLSTPEIQRGIGIVFVNLLNAIVKAAPFEDYILICQDDADLSPLNSWVLSRLKVLRYPPVKLQQPLYARGDDYKAIMQEFVTDWKPDFYWNPNPLMLNTYLPSDLNCKTAVTLHDIIPILLKEKYFDKWDEDAQKDYMSRLDILSKQTDLVLCVSEDAARTYKKFSKRIKGKVIPAQNACDEKLFWASRYDRKTDDPYILIVGGEDPRKNLKRAVSAFCKFAKKSEIKYRLVFCSILSDKTVDMLKAMGEKARVTDQLDFQGFVTSEKLSELYRNAAFSLFPSEYEGFGLPILESLKSGTYVTCSNIPTSVEIGGDFLTYFDPVDEKSIVNALKETSTLVAECEDIKEKCLEKAGAFSWNGTAQKYLGNFRQAIVGSKKTSDQMLKIAMLTPWPPQKSGIADYAKGVAKAMAPNCDLDIFAPGDEETGFVKLKGARIKFISNLYRARKKYDKYIIHIGNNVEFHKEVYDWLIKKKPDNALIVLHDAIIHPFLQHAYLHTGETQTYLNALKFDVTEDSFEEFSEMVAQGRNLSIQDHPLSGHLSQFGKVLVHNKFSRNLILEKSHTDLTEKVKVWPLACEIPSDVKTPVAKQEFEICVFGYINSNKRPASCVKAFAKLIEFGLPAKLTFVGKVNDPDLDMDEILHKAIPNPDIREKVNLTGFVSEEEFSNYLETTDLIWNLRYPTMGESSATLHTAIGRSKAIITSDYGQFREYPNEVIWKVPVDETEVQTLFELSKFLLMNEDVRNQLGANAGAWAKDVLDFNIVAQKYLEL